MTPKIVKIHRQGMGTRLLVYWSGIKSNSPTFWFAHSFKTRVERRLLPVANYLVSVGSARQVNKGVCAASLLAGIQDWLWSVTLLIGHHQMWECEEGRASNREFYGLKFQLVWRQPGNHLLTMWEFGQSGLVGKYVDRSQPMAGWRCAMPTTPPTA